MLPTLCQKVLDEVVATQVCSLQQVVWAGRLARLVLETFKDQLNDAPAARWRHTCSRHTGRCAPCCGGELLGQGDDRPSNSLLSGSDVAGSACRCRRRCGRAGLRRCGLAPRRWCAGDAVERRPAAAAGLRSRGEPNGERLRQFKPNKLYTPGLGRLRRKC